MKRKFYKRLCNLTEAEVADRLKHGWELVSTNNSGPGFVYYHFTIELNINKRRFGKSKRR